MSDAMTPNQATLVTTLAATDHLLATDATGNIKRITRANAVSQDAAKGYTWATSFTDWVRVASIGNCVCASGIVHISCGYLAESPAGYALLIQTRHKAGTGYLKPSIKILGGDDPLSLQVRAIQESGPVFHIEIKCSNRRVQTAVSGTGVNLVDPKVVTDTDIAGARVHSYTSQELLGGGKALLCNTLRRSTERRAA